MLVSSKVFGSILIVAGTSIGASMLALPMISSSLGEIRSLFLLIMIWLLGYYSSLMVLKVNLFYKGAFSVSELCKKSFNSKIWLIADLSIITLFYSLLAAYMSGIVEISMSENIESSSNLLSKGVIGYLVVGILVFFIIFNFKVLDVSNRIIFVMKIGIFITMLYFLSSKVELNNLKNLDGYLSQNNNFLKAIPVFFTSFGFHGSIPFIMKYLDNNEKNIKKAFLWGSFLSLIIYCLWIFFTSAVLPKYGLVSFDAVNSSDNKLHEFIKMLAERTEQDKLHIIISVFSWMAKSPDQFRQSAANKVANSSLLNTNFITIPSNANSVDELANVNVKVQELEKEKEALSKEKLLLEEENKRLKTGCVDSNDETTPIAPDDQGNNTSGTTESPTNEDTTNEAKPIAPDDQGNDTSGTTESPINDDPTNEAKPTAIQKLRYDKFAPILEKIKAEYFLSDDKDNTVTKSNATSIRHTESNTKCFQIGVSNLKSIESESSDCEKIYSLHNFLDSIGMDKDDANHHGFLNFMSTNNVLELKSVVASNFNNFLNQYSGICEKGRKLLKYMEGQECFKMENEKVSTYGENSFSDECTPLINLYMLLQTANDKEIWHYKNYDLKNHDDTEFQNILVPEFTDCSSSTTTEAL